MRIYSPFRDYYDMGSRWDTEHLPAFHRVPHTFTAKRASHYYIQQWEPVQFAGSAQAKAVQSIGLHLTPHRFLRQALVQSVVIGFCGELYTALRYDGKLYYHGEELKKHKDKDKEELKRVISLLKNKEPVPNTDLFRQLQTPIFVVNKVRPYLGGFEVQINANLSAYEFVRVVDPVSTWQRIDQFLGNELATQVDPPIAISDELRRDIHGFDNRSFKKGPGGPTRKRKKKR